MEYLEYIGLGEVIGVDIMKLKEWFLHLQILDIIIDGPVYETWKVFNFIPIRKKSKLIATVVGTSVNLNKPTFAKEINISYSK